MRHRFIVFVGWLLLACPLLRAQTAYTCQYWFDGNYAAHTNVTSDSGHWQTTIETCHLTLGLHTVYLHLQDTSGQWSSPQSYLFYRIADTLSQPTASYYCWFDQDRNTLQQGNIGSGNLLIETATIREGLHTLNLQLGDGAMAHLQSFLFYKVPTIDSGNIAITYSCWFDQDTSTMQSGSVASGHLLIDAASISIGLHTLNLQLNADGLTQLQSYMFYRMPIQDTGTAQMVYRCWFDQDYTTLQQGNIVGGHLLIETASLSDGFHTLNIELGSGSMARLSSHLFMKMASIGNATDTTPLLWHYSIDGRDYPPISVSRNGGLIHLDVDVSTIPEGLHTLSHFMTTQQGTTFGVNSSLFYKIPVGGNGVKRYEYWFNDDYANRVTAVLDTVADPFRLVQLLDVDTLPFRSMSFQFDPNGGSPRCYAKNKIDFRFWDGMSRYVSRSAEFVDQRVMQVVTADTLERDTTKVIPVPDNNAIHWFKLYAGVGDSLSFHTDRHCTLQLFAPSGEEVFSANGQDVLTWHGCHSWEDGVYYLAVHDAEGTGNISVSYQWIYRYAVLAWDVHRVGNGGISTITFEGNGFNSLDTVFLVKGTDTIPALYLDHESNTTTGIVFNFEGADTGMYNAVFEYVDETLPVSNTVSVETALPIVLTSNVSYPSTFLRGSTVTYTYEITNTGNMTAYNVPLYTYIGSHLLNSITHLEFNGLNLPSIIADMNLNSLSENEKQELQDWAEEVGDDHYFFKLRAYDSIAGDSIWVRSNYFFLTMTPYETRTLSLEIATSAYVDVWFTLPDTIPPLVTPTFDTIPHPLLMMPKSSSWGGYARDGYCCVKDHIACILNITSEGLDIAELIADAAPGTPVSLAINASSCIVGLAQNFNTGMSKWLCREENSGNWFNHFQNAMDWESVTSTAIKCVQRFIPHMPGKKIIEIAGKITEMIDNTLKYSGYSHASTVVDCITAFSKKQTNCPPIPPKGGKATPVVPVDPNEITGYLAESGSHVIGAEVMQLPFMIEFENDTAFATAHAHTVVVHDTLDGSVYDLNSFSATAFSIGDKITTINGGRSFTRTVDMRPTIDALAQVQLEYRIDTSFAVATWTFTSLDPMTLLPAADSLGFLGIGKTGEVNFTINRKADLPDSTLIDNRAWIVFDNEEPIATSTWRNIIDNTPPVSSIDSISYTGSTATVTITATDNLSGAWRYNVYALMDGDVLLPMAMDVPIDSAAVFTTPDEVVLFRSTAIDSAGNVEPLVLTPLITTVYDTLTITACDNYTWGDSLYTISGEYTKSKTATLRNAPDTITSLFLTINNSTTGTETATACDSYTWHGTTYTASTSNATYSTINALGCDSTITLHLTINNSTTGTETITACDSYIWHGTAYTASTSTPTYLTANAAGCDSTVTLHLTINHSTNGTETITACDSYTWHGTAYTSSTNTPTYTTTNSVGCDSTVTLHLTINNSTTATEAITACDSYTWHGTAYTASTNTPTYSTLNSAGCDSTVTLHLTINNSTSAIETITACDSYTWHDSTYTASTLNSQFSTLNSVGCDSTVTLHLTINNSTSSTESITACDSYTWHGTAYTTSTNTPTYTTTNSVGCDSTITLHLTINNSTTATEDITACDSYTWHGTAYTTSTNTPTYTTNNIVGCDSTITLHLTINNSTSSTESITACDSYTWHDSTYTTSTNTSTYTTTNSVGCDSTITLHLTINYSTNATENITACDSYTWHDSTYTASTLNSQFSTLNSVGCDSTVTLHLTINYSSHDTVVDTGVNQYEWNGETYTESGEYIYEGQTEAGCDSIVVLQLTITNVGIADVTDLDGITIYPNPTTGKLTIDVEGVLKVEVYDNSGRLVGTFVNTNQLDLTHLPTGTYALRISLQKGNTVRRVIKQ